MLCRSAYVLVDCITAPQLTQQLFAIFVGENRALTYDMVGLCWDKFFKNIYLDIQNLIKLSQKFVIKKKS